MFVLINYIRYTEPLVKGNRMFHIGGKTILVYKVTKKFGD